MNYLAHALPFLESREMVIGTAIPDWVRVVNRRFRARAKTVRSYLSEQNDSPKTTLIAQGILQHHHDDDWFHNTEAFLRLSTQWAKRLRPSLEENASMRAGFVGHIAVELLLDAAIVEKFPDALQKYYQILDSVDGTEFEQSIAKILGMEIPRLGALVRRFSIERFIYDYLDDLRLLKRMNQVMLRVKLPPLPENTIDWLCEMREEVYANRNELLIERE